MLSERHKKTFTKEGFIELWRIRARGGNRTRTHFFGEQDFKSCVSTNSTTRAEKKNPSLDKDGYAERKTRFEPATLTLAR